MPLAEHRLKLCEVSAIVADELREKRRKRPVDEVHHAGLTRVDGVVSRMICAVTASMSAASAALRNERFDSPANCAAACAPCAAAKCCRDRATMQA